MASLTKGVLIDVTQFMSRPIASGVQRVLGHLARRWPQEVAEARFGYLQDSCYVTVPLSAFSALVDAVFAHSGTISAELAEARLAPVAIPVAASELERYFDAYLLPEPAPRRDVMMMLHHLMDEDVMPVCGIAYDAFPVTSPWLFQDIDLRPYDRFFATFSAIENMVFISSAARREFEARLRHRPCRHGRVVPLGADGLMEVEAIPMPNGRDTVVVVGSVEPRKRQAMVVEAMDELWKQGSQVQLLVLGRPGPERQSFLEDLRRRSQSNGLLRWNENAADATVAGALRSAAALVFISSDEGYGLPAVEALALGCPLVAAADVPALADIDTAGQMRLADVTTESLSEALLAVTEPLANQRMRDEVATLTLPTWADFARSLVDWLVEVVEDS